MFPLLFYSTMKIIQLVAFLLILLFISCFPSQMTEESSIQILRSKNYLFDGDYLAIYLDSLRMIDPFLADKYFLNTKEDRKEIIEDIERFRKYASSNKITDRTIPQETLAQAEILMAVKLFRFKKQQELLPDQQEIASYYEKNREDYAHNDYIQGSRILIEYGEEAEKLVEKWTEKLEHTSDSFENVAREFYKTQGQLYDGSFGLVERGQIRDDIFEMFYAQVPSEPYFGPVETRHGYLLGKLHEKGEAGYKPLSEVQNKISRILLAEEREIFFEEFYKEERKKHSITVYLDPDAEEAPAFDEAVYSFNDHTYTYREILNNLPHIFGDIQSVSFCKAVMEKNIQMDLIYASEEVENIMDSTSYSFLLHSFRDRYIIHRYIQQRLDEFEPTEEEIINFHEEYQEDYYTRPAEAKLLIFSIQRNPDRETHPYKMHQASQEAWEFAQLLHTDFLRFEPEEYPLKNLKDQKGLRITHVDTFTPIDQLGRLIAMDIQGKEEGYTSSLLIDRSHYLFYHIFEIYQPTTYSLDEVKNRVIQDMKSMYKKQFIDSL